MTSPSVESDYFTSTLSHDVASDNESDSHIDTTSQLLPEPDPIPLQTTSSTNGGAPQAHNPPGSNILRSLYTSHFLSTWNSRLFEFGAILFLGEIFPGTLLPASVYALTRSAAAVVGAPALGRWVDGGERLGVVRWSIGMFILVTICVVS
jgi:hypothetical protein